MYLEELELLRVERCCLIKGLKLLDNDVRMTLDHTSTVQLLRSSEVIGSGVDEETGIQVPDVQDDRERGVWRNESTVGRIFDLG